MAQSLRTTRPNEHTPDGASWQHDHRTLADLVDYEWLTGPEAAGLLDEVALNSEPVHRQLNRLRKTLTAERARLVVQQVELRQRAVTKFGDFATKMFFTDIALQQATDLWIARYKASRIPDDQPLVDFCCGIGGDLLAFAQRGPTTGWDRAPELVHLANANLRAQQDIPLPFEQGTRLSLACVGDVESQTPSPNEIWHLDPDRRTDGRRSTQIQWHSPGPELVDCWLKICPTGILKLAPATVVPEAWSHSTEREWITQNRECRQQIAWFGELASAGGQHRATRLLKNPTPKTNPFAAPSAASFLGPPNIPSPLTTTISRYLFDTDPSIRAAGLMGALATELGFSALKKGASYLTSDCIVDHPLLTCFEVLDSLPLRAAKLSKHLRSLNIGQLEIKKRGVDTDLERLRKQLKLLGSESATLLLTKLGKSEIALLARRVKNC